MIFNLLDLRAQPELQCNMDWKIKIQRIKAQCGDNTKIKISMIVVHKNEWGCTAYCTRNTGYLIDQNLYGPE